MKIFSACSVDTWRRPGSSGKQPPGKELLTSRMREISLWKRGRSLLMGGGPPPGRLINEGGKRCVAPWAPPLSPPSSLSLHTHCTVASWGIYAGPRRLEVTYLKSGWDCWGRRSYFSCFFARLLVGLLRQKPSPWSWIIHWNPYSPQSKVYLLAGSLNWRAEKVYKLDSYLASSLFREVSNIRLLNRFCLASLHNIWLPNS